MKRDSFDNSLVCKLVDGASGDDPARVGTVAASGSRSLDIDPVSVCHDPDGVRFLRPAVVIDAPELARP